MTPLVTNRFVYGPVPSRRLGRSLGVDLVPFKTCSYDCIYCQLGHTTYKTTALREYVPVDDLQDEVAEQLRSAPRPDFIGLAGSGEPTLHARIGDIIAGIKALTRVPVAVFTNGSLLWKPEVRAGLAEADLVLPSLDAGDQLCFERVNRPHPEISFERMVDGLVTFAQGYKGTIWLEVFVLGGITDRPEQIGRMADIVNKIRPTRAQLNTVSRPPAEACARAAPREALESLQKLLSVPSEIVAELPSSPGNCAREDSPPPICDREDEIVALLRRRPCTIEGIAVGLGRRSNEVLKHLEVLCARGSIRSERRCGDVFYAGASNQ